MKRILLILITCILFSFTTSDIKSEYNIPISPYSIASADLHSDNDEDIIIGHLYSFVTEWSGITVMTNDEEASFQIDSLYLYDHHWDILVAKIDTGNKYDQITQGMYNQNYAIVVVFNIVETTSNLQYLNLEFYPSTISIGDISADYIVDILFCSYSDKVWGTLLNDGQGDFSSPTYYNLNYNPTDIKCGKLNEDNYDDIVIGGADLTIKFPTGTGFQTLVFDAGVADIEIVDIDNDGDNDIIGFDDLYFGTEVTFFENTGNSTFFQHENWEFTPGCYYLTVSDFNNDSLPDLFFHANSDNGMYFYYNLGEFDFDSPVFFPFTNYGESSRKSASADFDNNGFNDLVILRSHGAQLTVGNVTILFNDGQGNFVEDPITGSETPNSKLQTPNLLCYPNPFTTQTTISFTLEKNERVQLQVFDINGQLIQNLLDEQLPMGEHKHLWNGTDKFGSDINNGVYFIKIISANYQNQIIKIIKN